MKRWDTFKMTPKKHYVIAERKPVQKRGRLYLWATGMRQRILHRHDYRHTEQSTAFNSSEAWYWHVDQCISCGKTKTVLNGYCGGRE